ncbi:hypothetical protein ACFE04_016482 [Oxalis oulophora]
MDKRRRKQPKLNNSCNSEVEVSSIEWEFINMSEQEEDLISRMYKLVGDRWGLIAGRIPGRKAEEIERFWIMRHTQVFANKRKDELPNTNPTPPVFSTTPFKPNTSRPFTPPPPPPACNMKAALTSPPPPTSSPEYAVVHTKSEFEVRATGGTGGGIFQTEIMSLRKKKG